jgi:poly(3-hydroxybutyrate) depolymerase
MRTRGSTKLAWALCGLLSGLGCGDTGDDAPGDGDAGDASASSSTVVDGGEQSGDAARAPDSGTSGEDGGSARDGGTQQDAGRARDAGASDAARDAESTRDAGAPAMGRSAGCGMAATSNGMFADRTVRVGDSDRSYHVRLPDMYDASRAYPLIFRFHGYGGDGLSGGLDIEYQAGGEAIIVGPDGLNQGWSSESEANDLLFFDAMYDAIRQRYCVDLARVFSYGFSMGAGMTNLLGCRRADKLRATAAIAGFDRGTGSCTRPVAAWFQHDQMDDAVDFAQGAGARDRMIMRNHCGMNSTPAGKCVSYQGCEAGYPVVWCETTGLGHNIAGDTAPKAVWDFFRMLP